MHKVYESCVYSEMNFYSFRHPRNYHPDQHRTFPGPPRRFPSDCPQCMPFTAVGVTTILTCIVTDWIRLFLNFIHVYSCVWLLSLSIVSQRVICVVCIQKLVLFSQCRMTHSLSSYHCSKNLTCMGSCLPPNPIRL